MICSVGSAELGITRSVGFSSEYKKEVCVCVRAHVRVFASLKKTPGFQKI